MFVHRLAAGAAVGALMLALSSCSEDPVKPKPLEPDSSSSSQTSSSSETAKPESAEDFIRRWRQLTNEMQATGDTSAYRAVTRNCVSCDNLADLVDSIYENGGYIEFEGSRVVKITRVRQFGRFTMFELRTRSGATKYTEEKGGPVLSEDGGKFTDHVTLERKGGHWFVVRFIGAD